MSNGQRGLSGLGISGGYTLPVDLGQIEHVLVRQPLQRILEFRGRTIDDVINSVVARNEIRLYWKYHKQIQRGSEINELERQWNDVPL